MNWDDMIHLWDYTFNRMEVNVQRRYIRVCVRVRACVTYMVWECTHACKFSFWHSSSAAECRHAFWDITLLARFVFICIHTWCLLQKTAHTYTHCSIMQQQPSSWALYFLLRYLWFADCVLSVNVCVYVRTYICIYIYIYIYICMYVCICVCVCVYIYIYI